MAENNELMVAEDNNGFGGSGDFICTVNLESPEGIANVANALTAAVPLKDRMGEELNVVDIVTTAGVRAVSKTPCKNVYLILDDGTALFSQSEGVAKAAEINATLRRGNFGDGVKMVCKEIPLNNGNTMKTLVVVQ